jgi:hypothetical protein
VTLVTGAVPDDRYGMNSIRLATATAAAVCLACVIPSIASAADYCVYPNQSCGPNNVLKLQSALDLAAGSQEADRVLLGEFTYVSDAGAGFKYAASSPVEIVGAGRGQTVLTAAKNATGNALLLYGDGGSVHDLTIRIPETPAAGFTGLKIDGNNTAKRIEVVEAQLQGGIRLGAAVWDGALLEDSTVTLESTDKAAGVSLDNTFPNLPAGVLRGSTVRAGIGVDSWDGGTIERSRIAGSKRAVRAVGRDNVIRDSVLTLTGSAGPALWAETGTQRDTSVTADGLTVVASQATLDTTGIGLTDAPDTTRNVHVDLTNSIVRAGIPLYAEGIGGGATISASYSDYDPANNVAAWNASIDPSHVTNLGDACFNETAGHEYELLPTSPLIDRGEPDLPQGLDLNGNARVADGNGDGFARRDLGAFELQPATAGPPPGGGTSGGPAADTKAPVVSGFRLARARLLFGHGTRLRWTLSEKARVVVKIQRAPRVRGGRYRTLGALKASAVQGANRLRFSGRIHRRALLPGRYRAVIGATDAAGNRSAPRVAGLRILR